MHIKSILDQLANDNSGLAKIAILQKHQDSQLLRDVLVAALNPHIQYFIRKIPSYTATAQKSLQEILPELKKLSERKVTGNAAIEFLQDLLSSLSDDDAYVLEKIIKKDLRCGVKESTVNKVWDKLVPVYPCLLGRPYSEKNLKNIVYPAYSQLKLDGMRVNIHVSQDGQVIIKGRSGKIIDLHNKLDNAFKKLCNDAGFFVGMMFDGELIVLNDDGTIMNRKKGNGILNKAIRGTISDKETSRVRVTLWDVITQDDFENEVSKLNYLSRFTALEGAVKTYPNEIYSLVETREVNNIGEAQEHFKDALAREEEGTLLKNFESLWEDSRSKDIVKFKDEKDCDLLVTGWNEGTGKYKGMLGSLVCQSSDGKVEVNIGSGFSDDDRENFTEELMIGKIVEIVYNERITNKANNEIDSLFLPRFRCLRENKTTPDSDNEIL